MSIDAGFEYVNARLRARKSRLLGPAAIEQLLAAPTIEALIGQLDQDDYHEALEESLVSHSGLLAVLRAVQIEQGIALRRIAHFSGETAAAALAILLAYTVRHNIIVLIRGVSVRASPDLIQPLLVALQPFKEGMLNELARQRTVRGLVNLLVQWRLPTSDLAQRLLAALAEGAEPQQLVGVFDQAWAETTTAQAAAYPGEDGELLQLNLARYLDLHNLLLALELRDATLETPVQWLPGGSLPFSALEQLRLAADTPALESVLAAASDGEFWRPGLAQWDGLRTVALQQAWERTLLQWRVSLFHHADPLGIGVLIAFLAAKEAETRNIRLIAEAVAGNLSRKEARRNLPLSSDL